MTIDLDACTVVADQLLKQDCIGADEHAAFLALIRLARVDVKIETAQHVTRDDWAECDAALNPFLPEAK